MTFWNNLRKPGFLRYSSLVIDFFPVVCSMAWHLNGSEAGGDLVLITTRVNQVVLKLISLHSRDKSGEVCIKAASLATI